MMPIIRTDDLKKTYCADGSAFKALDGINLSVNKGEFLSVMGASGSGKSTLMNIIGCIDTASYGQYLLNNIEITKMKKDELANIRSAAIGFVFQNFNLLPFLSASENVELPLIYTKTNKNIYRKKSCSLLEAVGLKERMLHKPGQLSGGERQRVAIARALINSPEILLADEPTGNLDSKSSLNIMEIFKELNKKGLTIILVTHERKIAEFGNRIITIQDGKIVKNENI
jgi:putative ABC transport system ATP-binding protein